MSVKCFVHVQHVFIYIHMFATNNYAKPQNSNVIKQPLFKQFKIRQAKVFNDIIMMFGHEQRRSDQHDVTLKIKKNKKKFTHKHPDL